MDCRLLTGCATPEDTANCTAMVAGGFRKVADERGERFNGKVGEEVARCRGGDKAAAFRPTPYVDWSNYWATGDGTSLRPGTTGVAGHLGSNGRGVDGALLDLEYQRMELIKFNLFDNTGTFTDYVLGRDGVPGTALKTWPSMRLPAGSPLYAAVGGDGPQLCTGELIRWRQLSGVCNDIVNPRMGSTGTLFARNVQFEATYPDISDDQLARNRHGDRLSLLQPDPQLISRKLFTRTQSDPARCRDGQGLPAVGADLPGDHREPFLAAGQQRHPCALLGQQDRDGLADAAGGSGDDGGAPGQVLVRHGYSLGSGPGRPPGLVHHGGPGRRPYPGLCFSWVRQYQAGGAGPA